MLGLRICVIFFVAPISFALISQDHVSTTLQKDSVPYSFRARNKRAYSELENKVGGSPKIASTGIDEEELKREGHISNDLYKDVDIGANTKKKIFVLGGDGFCGWPTTLHLCSLGYEVVIIDNLSRRAIDEELGTESLTPIASIHRRVLAWNSLSDSEKISRITPSDSSALNGSLCVKVKKTVEAETSEEKIKKKDTEPIKNDEKSILPPLRFIKLDLRTEYREFVNILEKEKPHCVVHFAEQRAAPYSMKSSTCARYTVDNNITTTHNVLSAIVEALAIINSSSKDNEYHHDIKLIHLGTMGVYGYCGDEKPNSNCSQSSNLKVKQHKAIPEGYLQVLLPSGDSSTILHPARPGSIYHLTKCLDALLFQFYNKNYKLDITDLHQGIVWGTNTCQTRKHVSLINRFDYDADYGTVLNRFLLQSALGLPITVYGTGGQTRAFIFIEDTCRCIELAVRHAVRRSHGEANRVLILNQVSETLQINELARHLEELCGAKIMYLPNPREEADENSLYVAHTGFRELGWTPTKLRQSLLKEVQEVAKIYRNRCNETKIMPSSFWNRMRARRYKSFFTSQLFNRKTSK